MDLTNLTEKAAAVAAQHAAFLSAIDTETSAEAEVLDLVIEAVRPALRALSSVIVRSSYDSAGLSGCSKEYFEERGVCLIDAFLREKDESGNCGQLCGSRLYLLTDGRLARVVQTGRFSLWQGEANVSERTLQIVTSRAAVDSFELAAILEALSELLDEQLAGAKAKRSKAALERADRLRALAALAR